MNDVVWVISASPAFHDATAPAAAGGGALGTVPAPALTSFHPQPEAGAAAVVVDLATVPPEAVRKALADGCSVPVFLMPAGAVLPTFRRRRVPAGSHSPVAVLDLNAEERAVRLGARTVRLTQREFRLLQALLERVNCVWDRETLLARMCGQQFEGSDRTVDGVLMRLRRRLFDLPECPVTVRAVSGVGYKLVAKGA